MHSNHEHTCIVTERTTCSAGYIELKRFIDIICYVSLSRTCLYMVGHLDIAFVALCA